LLKLFELPEDGSLLPDDHFIEVEDTPGYQAAYSKLAFAGDRIQSCIPGQLEFTSVPKGLLNLIELLDFRNFKSSNSPGHLPAQALGGPTRQAGDPHLTRTAGRRTDDTEQLPEGSKRIFDVMCKKCFTL
jgi:hypothetical protein